MSLWYAVEGFVDRGGPVLYAIALVVFVMWTLILERVWYLRTEHPRLVEQTLTQWKARPERSSWHAHQIRSALVSEISIGLERRLGLLQSLLGLCTLLGLLGTVTGMIQVFHIMALTGSSSARLMADGVSKATLPTMAGMVAALSGLYFVNWLQNRAKREAEAAADRLQGD